MQQECETGKAIGPINFSRFYPVKKQQIKSIMKKLLILLAAAIAFSCSDKQVQQQEPSISDAKVIEKIQDFYSNYIFGTKEVNVSVITQYCTKALAQKLRDDYDNEFSDGGGYAVWKFRSGAQDGTDVREIEKIESLGEGKFQVHYNDMGNKGVHTITIAIQNGEAFFDILE